MNNNHDLMDVAPMASKAMGGTELMQRKMYDGVTIPRHLLEPFQIIFSRVHKLRDDKIKILYLHDLPGDPACDHLKDGGWNKFELLVFVSNWQQQGFIERYGIPHSKTLVMQNAIVPIDNVDTKPTGKIKFIYHTTPHRGLNILVPVFQSLCKIFPDKLELDVYSSFKIYGWAERDKPYEELINTCKEDPNINYHGSVSNDEIHSALRNAHIYAYPSIWPETSCISLIEAMSARCVCVHPNYAALYETAANYNLMYQWNEDLNSHARVFHAMCAGAIEDLNTEAMQHKLSHIKMYTDAVYGWDQRAKQWCMLLDALIKRNQNNVNSITIPQK